MSTSTADDVLAKTVSTPVDAISSEQMSTSTADDVSTETATTPVLKCQLLWMSTYVLRI
jgi:hypothetical protein